ncbi:hypothetical protein D3C76_1231720 [compost metagenome]
MTLTDQSIQAPRQFFYHRAQIQPCKRALDLPMFALIKPLIKQGDILQHRSIEQDVLLALQEEKRVHLLIIERLPIDNHLPLLRCHQAGHHLQQGTFPRPRLTHNGNAFPRFERQGKVVQYRLLGVIGKSDIFIT